MFDLYRVNPPLVRAVAAIPVLFLAPETNWRGYEAEPWFRPEAHFGRRFVESNGVRCLQYFAIAHCACVPFSLLGACICFAWGRDLYGNAAGLCAAALWCFSPNILAHGADDDARRCRKLTWRRSNVCLLALASPTQLV